MSKDEDKLCSLFLCLNSVLCCACVEVFGNRIGNLGFSNPVCSNKDVKGFQVQYSTVVFKFLKHAESIREFENLVRKRVDQIRIRAIKNKMESGPRHWKSYNMYHSRKCNLQMTTKNSIRLKCKGIRGRWSFAAKKYSVAHPPADEILADNNLPSFHAWAYWGLADFRIGFTNILKRDYPMLLKNLACT